MAGCDWWRSVVTSHDPYTRGELGLKEERSEGRPGKVVEARWQSEVVQVVFLVPWMVFLAQG